MILKPSACCDGTLQGLSGSLDGIEHVLWLNMQVGRHRSRLKIGLDRQRGGADAVLTSKLLGILLLQHCGSSKNSDSI